jgi:hypothetical protein
MLSISTVTEAIAVLTEFTRRPWTESELFDLATKLGIELQAVVPITTQTSILGYEVDKGLVEKYRMPPGHSVLAVLFPWQVGQLWITGETRASHPIDHDRMEGEYKVLTEPIRVTRSEVRIVDKTLKKILKAWEDAQKGAIPSYRLPEWLCRIQPPAEPLALVVEGKTTTARTSADAMSGGTTTEASAIPINKWDEYGLRRLLDESKMPDMTHQKLAAKYGVKRQRIGALLKRAEKSYSPRKASPFAPLRHGNPKK